MAGLSAAPPPDEGAPPGARLALDPDLQRLDRGRALLGGYPLRIVRVTGAGARLVDAWQAGAPVGAAPAARRLARLLLAAGLAHPRPGQVAIDPARVEIVVPAQDRLAALRECLRGLEPAAEVLVVDDGSRDARGVAALAGEHGARLLRRDAAGGPAAARNTGLRATSAPLVAFVDSDCRPAAGWLGGLLGHFGDPTVAAVAPRVVGASDGSLLGRFEAARSPLDLGPRPSAVGPGRLVGYVPAAVLVVRRAACGDGFDEALRFGEDVDLVWRLARAGWSVRYEPSTRVVHEHRGAPLDWLRQRASYGASAGQLARRHPGQLAHLTLHGESLAPVALALAGRPRAGLVAALAGTGLWTARLPRVPRLRRHALPLALRAQGHATRQLATAAWRAYAPLTLPAALASRRAAGLLALAGALPALLEWRERRPELDPLRYAGLRLLDDLAYAAGLWGGCLRARSLAPLVPARRAGARRPPAARAAGAGRAGAARPP